MQLGMIGLGRMGANMVRRLIKGGHKCVVYDRSADAVTANQRSFAAPLSTTVKQMPEHEIDAPMSISLSRHDEFDPALGLTK